MLPGKTLACLNYCIGQNLNLNLTEFCAEIWISAFIVMGESFCAEIWNKWYSSHCSFPVIRRTWTFLIYDTPQSTITIHSDASSFKASSRPKQRLVAANPRRGSVSLGARVAEDERRNRYILDFAVGNIPPEGGLSFTDWLFTPKPSNQLLGNMETKNTKWNSSLVTLRYTNTSEQSKIKLPSHEISFDDSTHPSPIG